MKKILMILALALPLAVQAEEVNDTIVQYNGKRIVIRDDSVETHVAVFAKDSSEYRKTRETSFAGEQEIERFYVTSPLFGSNMSKSHYSSMFPTLWYGSNQLTTKIGNSDKEAGLHGGGNSYELGMTVCEFLSPINKRGDLLFSFGVQVAYERYNFQNSALLYNEGRHIGFTDVTDNPASINSLSITTERLPFMLGWAPFSSMPNHFMDIQMGIGLTPELRFGGWYKFRPQAFGDPIQQRMKVYNFGLNLDLKYVFGPIKIGASAGLLPMFKTTDGKKAYRTTDINIGINLGEMFRKKHVLQEVIENY